jgi:hypothetical protein
MLGLVWRSMAAECISPTYFDDTCGRKGYQRLASTPFAKTEKQPECGVPSFPPDLRNINIRNSNPRSPGNRPHPSSTPQPLRQRRHKEILPSLIVTSGSNGPKRGCVCPSASFTNNFISSSSLHGFPSLVPSDYPMNGSNPTFSESFTVAGNLAWSAQSVWIREKPRPMLLWLHENKEPRLLSGPFRRRRFRKGGKRDGKGFSSM